jgi:molecular chaperone DnaK
LERLKEAHKAQNIDAIDSAMTEVNTAFQAASQDMYNAQAQSGGAQQQGPDPNMNQGDQPGGGGVTDVDFEEVK